MIVASIQDLVPELLERCHHFTLRHGPIGGSVGIVRGDDLVWRHEFGWAESATRRATDTSTLYRVASITKTFTAAAVMRLRDEGRLDLDDPLVDHCPELNAAGRGVAPIERVTLRALLSHESGLLGDPPGTDWSRGIESSTFAEILARVGEIAVVAAPFAASKYSNLGFLLLGEVVARASGLTYVDYVNRNLLEPLGMSSSGWEPLPSEMKARLAVGHQARSFADHPAVAQDNPPVWADGGLVTSVGDLARWLSLQLSAHRPSVEGDLPVDRATLRSMHAPRYLSDSLWRKAYGIGWYSLRRGESIWVGHGGSLHGFTSYVGFHPGSQLGVIVLLNGEAAPTDLALDLGEFARTHLPTPKPETLAPTGVPPAYAALLGLYTDQTQAEFTRVEWARGALVALVGEERLTLLPADATDEFRFGNGRPAGESARFARGHDGRVVALIAGPQTLWRFDRVDTET